MSLTQTVADIVMAKGCASLDDLYAALRGRCTRQQVIDAMKNARGAGLIHCDGAVVKRGKGTAGRAAAMHFPGPKPPEMKPKKRVISVRPPNSAWELGQGLQIAGEWPPVFENGRQHVPLGPWNEVTL